MFEINENTLPKIIALLPKIAKEAFSEKNQERFKTLRDKIGDTGEETGDFLVEFIDDVSDCMELVVDILRDPLAVAGIELSNTRAIGKKESDIKNRIIAKLNDLK